MSQETSPDHGRSAAAGVLRIFAPTPGATRIVLVRHGEAVCNVSGVVGGPKGDTGLTELGRRQVGALAGRLVRTGELRRAGPLYASPLPRALETAELLRPAIGPEGLLPVVREEPDLSELRPGEADGMTWQQVIDTFGLPDWDIDADGPLAPGGESWDTFVPRASGCVRSLAERHPGEMVVAAVHAGVIEACLVAFLGVPPERQRRGWVRIGHASLTTWEYVGDEARWILLGFNDTYGVPTA
ncbi:MAG TPA: histidine phosphatase family protein [Acidimicrobiales bacterium]